MKRPKLNLRPLGETILVSSLLVIVLVVFNLFNGLLKPTTESFIAFGIILVSYLVFSGRVLRVSAGAFSLWMKEEVTPNKFELTIAELLNVPLTDPSSQTVTKSSQEYLMKVILPRLYKDRITTLSLTEGEKYTSFDLINYLTYLKTSPYFRHVVFIDRQGRFGGVMDPIALLQLLQLQQGRNYFETLLKEWNLSDIPGVIKVSVPATTTNREALRKMFAEGLDTLPVVSSSGAFMGIVTREEIVSRSIYKLITDNRISQKS